LGAQQKWWPVAKLTQLSPFAGSQHSVLSPLLPKGSMHCVKADVQQTVFASAARKHRTPGLQHSVLPAHASSPSSPWQQNSSPDAG
jgi:hypothetical protein